MTSLLTKISYRQKGFVYLSIMPAGITIHEFLLFYAGISFLAIFYWLTIFLYSKRPNYIPLVAVTALGAIYYLSVFEVILHSRKADLLFLALLIVAFCALASGLNEFRKNLPSFIFIAFATGMVSSAVFLPLSPLFFPWQTAMAISHALTITGGIVVSCLFLYLWAKKGMQTARFSFFVYLPNITGYAIFAFAQMNIITAQWKVAGPVGASIFLLATSYGMVTYVITLRKKREKEQLEKQALIVRQNILLEQKIAERALELKVEKRRSEELLIKASQKQMAELELQSLRTRLNPHFMFNSLNAIEELILKEDMENAHTYLARFAKLLRMLLENTEKPFTPLQKEIEFLELYLSLEKLRLPDLQFTILTDPAIDKEETLVPNMILQPYVENALWHGLSHKNGDRQLELNIQKRNGITIYDVKDNGVGRKKSAELKSRYRKHHQSKGMDLLAKRFQLLRDEFGSDIQTEISDVMKNGMISGTNVSIRVPDSVIEKNKICLHDTHHYN
jgi:sensor histidine kinase YesM